LSPTERLQKVLAAAGIASRRASEDIIAEGRVQVNGKIVTEMGVQVDLAVDEIRVDGMPLPRTERHVYVLLNKPVGVLSSAGDDRGRTTVLDLVPTHERIYPVGRLDVESEGLILLTNDGEMTEHLTHPRYGHPREYRVLVRPAPPEGALKKLRRGIQLEDGPTGPAEVEFMPEAVLRREKLPFATEGAAWMKVVIHEGRKRQIRYMFEHIGCPVLRLIRVSIGPLELGDLPVGQYRFLNPDEIKKLRLVTGQAERRNGPRARRRPFGSAVARTRRAAAEGKWPRARDEGTAERRPSERGRPARPGASAADRPGRAAPDSRRAHQERADRPRQGRAASDRRGRDAEESPTPRADLPPRERRRREDAPEPRRRERDDQPDKPDRRSASRRALDEAYKHSNDRPGKAAGRAPKRKTSDRGEHPGQTPGRPERPAGGPGQTRRPADQTGARQDKGHGQPNKRKPPR
jgi:23S rRNA pseudouridine2605 synthase